ncbi:hypothetical protein BKA70DRAFT_1304390 [Coprinopsis sp. MPI-PUGE-AT-0042]|nr:hypothetical protein BKA70DRAFT_1304390 [Coprinopsis sp. MPI-PUGE-AT-0042]
MVPGPVALLLLFSLLFCTTQGAIVNRTIDDWFGDSETGVRPVFLPTGNTWKDEQCTDCAINPDTGRAFQGTYTAATYGKDGDPISITMDFEGTAIYVFFILANNGGDGITTETQCSFTIDGGSSTSFSHVPNLSTRTILYDQLVFSRTGLSNSKHTLRIETGGFDRDIYVNFDRAVYSFDDAVASPSSSNPPPSSSRDPTPSSSGSSSQQPSPTSSRSVSSGGSNPSQTFSSILPPGSSAPPNSDQSNSGEGSEEGSQSSSPPIGGIVGGLVGGLAALGILGFLALCFLRRRKRERNQHLPPPQPPQMQSQGRTTPLVTATPLRTHSPRSLRWRNPRGRVLSTRLTMPMDTELPGGIAGAQNAEYRGFAGAQNAEYNPYHAPAGNGMVNPVPPAYNTEGSVYSSPYGGMANMGSQSSRSQDPSSDFSHRRLVALNPDQASPLMVAGLTPQEQTRRARQEELDRQMATVEKEIHELDRDLKRGDLCSSTNDPTERWGRGARADHGGDAGRQDGAYTPDPVQWSAAARPPVPRPAQPVTSF